MIGNVALALETTPLSLAAPPRSQPLAFALLAVEGKALRVEFRANGLCHVLDVTADQLLHRRRQLCGRLLEEGLRVVRVANLEAWEGLLREACSGTPLIREASALVLEKLEGTGAGVRAWFRVDEERVRLDLSGRDVHNHKKVRARLLTEQRVLVPRTRADDWQDQLRRAMGQRASYQRVAGVVSRILGGAAALPHEGCFGEPEREALSEGRVLVKAHRLYVACAHLRARLEGAGAWEGRSVLTKAIEALGGGEHRLGPSGARIRVWSFEQSIAIGASATDAEAAPRSGFADTNAAALVKADLRSGFVDTNGAALVQADLRSGIVDTEAAPLVAAREGLAVRQITLRGQALSVEFGSHDADERGVVLTGLALGQLLARRRLVASALVERGEYGLTPVPGLAEWEQLLAAGFRRSALAVASTLALEALERTDRGVRAWLRVDDAQRIPLDLSGPELLSHAKVRVRLAEEKQIYVPRLRDAEWQELLASGLGQPPRSEDRTLAAPCARWSREALTLEAPSDGARTADAELSLSVAVAPEGETLRAAFTAGEQRAVLELTFSQLLGQRTAVAGRLLEQGLLRAPSREEWERVLAEGFGRSGFATASSLAIEGIERVGERAGIRAWLLADGRRIPLDLGGAELLSHERVRVRLVQAQRLFVPRMRDADWSAPLSRAARSGAGTKGTCR